MATEKIVTKLTGMSIPFRRSGASDFAFASEDAEINSNVILVLTTPLGFLPWRPDFGSKLTTLRHSLDTTILREAARIHIMDALARWVPYVRVIDVRVTSSRATKTMNVALDYEIVRNNTARGPVLSATFVTSGG